MSNPYYPDGMNSLPREPEILGYDFKGDVVREGDRVWFTDSGYVHYEDAEEFLDEVYGQSSDLDASGR